ncbi:MAG TPA: glucokinase [Chromatiales bacterium]|nr:glucokinase [Chromatiales bacterium]
MNHGVLVADVGGTTTRVRLCSLPDLRVRAEQDYPSAEYPDLASLLRRFLAGQAGIEVQAACLAVAGPVRDGRAKITNLPWRVSESGLALELGMERVRLVNDFEAIGHALPHLPAADFHVLQAGQPEPRGNRLLLGAGTGLGTAVLARCGNDWQVLPGEGGHMDFAPRTAQQQALLAWLWQQQPRVSLEMLVSGPGLERIYRYLDGTGETVMPEAAMISRRGLSGEDRRAEEALALFVSLYAAAAANLALPALATGGVYLAGGIAPRLVDKLDDGSFVRTFRDTPAMADLLAAMPVKVVLNERAGLLGAARLARILATGPV